MMIATLFRDRIQRLQSSATIVADLHDRRPKKGTQFRNRHLHNYITAFVNRSISLDRKHTGAQLLAAVRTSRHQYTSQWTGVMSGLAD